jgi:U32 family peptidase
MTDTRPKPHLVAPAGDWAALRTALKAGADAVYFGLDRLNMRATAANFGESELGDVVAACHDAGAEAHLALNTMVHEEERNDAARLLDHAAREGVDQVICWDLAVLDGCRERGLPACVSTQASVSNAAAANAYGALGARRVVLARECSLTQIRDIRAATQLELEVFIHGAMCIAVSGRCFLSAYLYGRSGNRGACLQPCRREFIVRDNDDPDAELVLGEDYVLSPKDLCTVEFLDEIVAAGVDALKIEGRRRNPEYVAATVGVYREALAMIAAGDYPPEARSALRERLGRVYNRGFSSGFFFGRPGQEDYARHYGSMATERREHVGRVLNHYPKAGAVWIRIEAAELRAGDRIVITGPTTGLVEVVVSELREEETSLDVAHQGQCVTFPCPEKVRENDQVYRVVAVAGNP